MSHIVKKEKGNNVQFYCNKNMARGAIGTALKKGRPPPFYYLDAPMKGPTLHSLHATCKKCLEGLPESMEQTWLVRVGNYLKKMREIHIMEKLVDGTGVRMMCGQMWAADSLFKNDVGYIEVEDLAQHVDKVQFCGECTDHPRAQLQILAFTDLGEW